MNKISKRTIFLVVLFSVLATTVMVSPYWFQKLPFEYGGDLKPTYFPYYTEFRALISNFLKNGKLPFYSWNLFLGNDFWSSKSFYMLGDVYYYISLAFKEHFYKIFEIQTFLKLSVSTLTMFLYLKYQKNSDLVAVTLALCYGFSSWVIFFLGQPMFVSAYSWMPLFLLSVDIYLKEKRVVLFMIVTIILLFTNYYMFFSLSFFTPAYFIARYYSINKGFKGFLKSTLYLIGIYFIAVLCTMVMILPSALYIAQNDRVGTFYFAFLFDQWEIYFHQIQALFVPSQNVIYQDYNLYETGSHVTRELTLWAGSITALLLPQVFADRNKYFRRSMYGMYVFMIIILIIPSGNMMIMGFSSPSFRWTFLFIIINLFVASRYLNDLTLINIKILKISMGIIAFILLFNIPIALTILNKWSDFTDYAGLYYLSLVSLFVFIALYFLIKLNRRHSLLLISIITITQLVAHNTWLIGFIRLKPESTWEFVDRATHVLQSQAQELNTYLLGFDDENYRSFYRTYVPHESLYWSYSHNHNLHYQLKGLMTYDSTYAPSFNDMKRLAPNVKDFDSDWIFNIKNPDIVDFLSTKYAIVTSIDELPHQNFKLLDDNFRGGLFVYENLNYEPIGRTYTDLTTYDKVMAISDENSRTEYLNTHIILKQGEYDRVQQMLGNEIVAQIGRAHV